jgi:hypothetical protein
MVAAATATSGNKEKAPSKDLEEENDEGEAKKEEVIAEN